MSFVSCAPTREIRPGGHGLECKPSRRSSSNAPLEEEPGGGGGGDVALEIHAMGMMLIVEWDESYSAVKNRIMSSDDVGSNKLDPWL